MQFCVAVFFATSHRVASRALATYYEPGLSCTYMIEYLLQYAYTCNTYTPYTCVCTAVVCLSLPVVTVVLLLCHFTTVLRVGCVIAIFGVNAQLANEDLEWSITHTAKGARTIEEINTLAKNSNQQSVLTVHILHFIYSHALCSNRFTSPILASLRSLNQPPYTRASVPEWYRKNCPA